MEKNKEKKKQMEQGIGYIKEKYDIDKKILSKYDEEDE